MKLRDQMAEETRVKIATAAKILFAREGFGVGIRTIAEAAGVSTGAMFCKWTSKESLFADVMGRPWPDPAAFARSVLQAPTLAEAQGAAEIFLADHSGDDGPDRRGLRRP